MTSCISDCISCPTICRPNGSDGRMHRDYGPQYPILKAIKRKRVQTRPFSARPFRSSSRRGRGHVGQGLEDGCVCHPTHRSALPHVQPMLCQSQAWPGILYLEAAYLCACCRLISTCLPLAAVLDHRTSGQWSWHSLHMPRLGPARPSPDV
jgi:hypothetical protein